LGAKGKLDPASQESRFNFIANFDPRNSYGLNIEDMLYDN